MKRVMLIWLFLGACSSAPVDYDMRYSMAQSRYEEYIRYAQDEQVRAIQWERTEALHENVQER